MAYSPPLSVQAICTLRRLAWALKVPMTKALEEVIYYIIPMIDHSFVCKNCQDKSKCQYCGFHSKSKNQ